MPELKTPVKLFILVELCAALMVFACALSQWSWSGATMFSILLALSVATGAMKVVLPGVQGNLSASYVFLMWGIVRMSLGETLLMGLAASLVQSYWASRRRPAGVQVLFNLCVTSLSIGAADLAFRTAFIQELVPSQHWRILLAAAGYFIANTVSVSIVIGLSERIPIWNLWLTAYVWSCPHYLLSASVVAAVEYLRKLLGMEVALLALPAVYLVYRAFVLQMAKLNEALERAEREKRHAEEKASLHLRMIRALALAIEYKDQTTGDHLHRVQTYAMGLAEEFGLPPEELEALRAAAILHDIGKIAVPEHIISKPGRLTPEEFALMKIHTIVGAEIVTSADFPFAVAPLVRAHHEKWDGSGYPDGLKGEEIPLAARILTTVDCLDALASDRQYRKALPLEQAMSMIAAEAGRSFDPKVVDALSRRCRELERLAKSTLPAEKVIFSINATVERGLAPDAGYATESRSSGSSGVSTRDEADFEVYLLNSINFQIGRSKSIQDDLLGIEKLLQQLIPFDCFALYQVGCEKLECIFARGDSASFLNGLGIESGVGASGWTLANHLPLLNGNAATEFGLGGPVHSEFALTSTISIPLHAQSGPVGVLTLYSRQANAFEGSHLRVLLAIASKLAYQMSLDSSAAARNHFDEQSGFQLAELARKLRKELPVSQSESARPVADPRMAGSSSNC